MSTDLYFENGISAENSFLEEEDTSEIIPDWTDEDWHRFLDDVFEDMDTLEWAHQDPDYEEWLKRQEAKIDDTPEAN